MNMRLMIRRWMNITAMVAASVIAYGSYIYYETSLRHLVSQNGLTTEIKVKRGDSIRNVAIRLEKRGIIGSAHIFFLAYMSQRSTNPLFAGNYAVYPGDTMLDLISRIHQGQVLQHSFTIVEGWTWKDILTQLKHNTRIEHSSESEITDFFSKHPFMIRGTLAHLEGVFLPDTYHFSSGVRDIEVLAHAYTAAQQYLQEAWPKRSPKAVLKDPYEALIIASLIERESRHIPEFNHISSVIHNRLRIGMPIQIDAALWYVRDPSRKGRITHLDTRKPSSYNTYRQKGLPPTPICNPSRSAIRAAMHPMEIYSC